MSRKFQTPPVKLACTNCRASRTRCDGRTTCTACEKKGKECIYTTSNRGGPRIHTRRRKEGMSIPNMSEGRAPTPMIEFPVTNEGLLQVSSLQYPGAGLAHLDPLVNFDALMSMDFDNYYMPVDSSPSGAFSTGQDGEYASLSTSNLSPFSMSTLDYHSYDHVRFYDSEEAILDAYYVWIHAYFPILPAPVKAPAVDQPSSTGQYHEPQSPLSNAICAILALIPHPNDLDPTGFSSVSQRRDQANRFAQAALHKIDLDSELTESTLQPGNALQAESNIHRQAFHPHTPIALESVLAMLVLSTYEYAQRGNLAKMRMRSSQALAAAMDLGLHTDVLGDAFCEARRRAWWMTFVVVCQSFIVSSTVLNLDLDDPRFVRQLPTNGANSNAWQIYLTAQKSIAKATKATKQLNEGLKAGTDLTSVFDEMRNLEHRIGKLIDECDCEEENYAAPGVTSVFPTEAVVATSLMGMSRIKLNSARIKLHRYCAFTDTAIFTQKHCDLTSKPANETPNQTAQIVTPPCCTPLPNATSSEIQENPNRQLSLPFPKILAMRTCHESAQNIIKAFQSLPFPNPSGSIDLPSSRLSPKSASLAPRTMPGFACCAMQSSYALLMLIYRSRSQTRRKSLRSGDVRIGTEDGIDRVDGDEYPSMVRESYEEGLVKGLRIILEVLKNYSLAFEALGGMKDQVETALKAISVEPDS